MTTEERARELALSLSADRRHEATILAALLAERRAALEEAADLMLTKARENDAKAKATKIPAGSGSHLAANVYRNAKFAIDTLRITPAAAP